MAVERLAPNTLTTVEELRADLERIAKRGYGVANEEHEEGVSGVAVPIFDRTDLPCAAISVSAPTPRIVHAETDELETLLRRQPEKISAALGHRASNVREGAGQDADRSARAAFGVYPWL